MFYNKLNWTDFWRFIMESLYSRSLNIMLNHFSGLPFYTIQYSPSFFFLQELDKVVSSQILLIVLIILSHFFFGSSSVMTLKYFQFSHLMCIAHILCSEMYKLTQVLLIIVLLAQKSFLEGPQISGCWHHIIHCFWHLSVMQLSIQLVCSLLIPYNLFFFFFYKMHL